MINNGGMVIVVRETCFRQTVLFGQWMRILGIVLSRSTVEVREECPHGVYTVRLNRQPTGNVLVRAEQETTTGALKGRVLGVT